MPKIIFALLTLGTLAAQAEYSTVHADCLFQNSALAGERLQVWFTFRSAVGLPSDPFPQQVIYSLVSLSSDGTALSRVRAVRSTENLDVKTVDKKLKSVAVISNDGKRRLFLKVDIGSDGKAEDSCAGTYEVEGVTGPAESHAIKCEKSQALFAI